MTEQEAPKVPPHVERFLDEARQTMAILCMNDKRPVRLVFRWRMDDKSYGDIDQSYKAPAKRKAEVQR